MKRQNGALHDETFRDIINHLKQGDLIVANETRVMPARLFGNQAQHRRPGRGVLAA